MDYWDKKYALKYKPTNQWVFLEHYEPESPDLFNIKYYVHLLDEFHPDMLWAARNILDETIATYSCWAESHCNSDPNLCGSPNYADFEIVTVSIVYAVD